MIRTSKMSNAEFEAFVLAHSVSGGKGDKTVEQGEHSQAGFNNVLQAAFKQQFGASSAVLNFLNGKLTDMANNPTGFSPQALAAARTNAIQQSATDVNNATKAAQASAAAHGGNGLPSGVQAQIAGQIQAAGANEESNNLNQINLANEQQRQQNYWAAIQGLGSVANAENPTGFGSLANGGQSALASLSGADTAAKQTSFGNELASGFGSALGKGLGGFATSGLSGAFGGNG